MSTSSTTTQESLTERIEALRTEAEQAKKAQNFEFAFLLFDQADALEEQQIQTAT